MKNLVTAADVKRYTTVGKNASDEKLAQAVPDSETRHLRPLLGPRLYAELLAFAQGAPEPPVLVGLSGPAAAAAVADYQTQLSA